MISKNLFKNTYKNKKVLVTGHTGFKGAWLALWLTELGAEVVGYALEPPTNPSLFTVLKLAEKIQHITGDIRDGDNLKAVFQQCQPEIVFHLAAQSLVRLSYQEPQLTYETNIMGTVNLYEAVRKTTSVKTVVNITSDKCYQNQEWVYGYRENDPMGGYDPYSSSKGCAELITTAYRNSFFNVKDYGQTHQVALASVRAGNVIGGGDWAADRLVPDCIRALTKNEEIYIRNPQATRPWQHVLEPLSAYLWLAALMNENPIAFSTCWNFGPNDEDILTVAEIVKKVIELWGAGSYQVNPDTKYHEVKLLKLDVSKAHVQLKWRPVYRADKALEQTVSWYREYYKGNSDSIYNYTIRQIQEYIDSAREKGLEWAKNEDKKMDDEEQFFALAAQVAIEDDPEEDAIWRKYLK